MLPDSFKVAVQYTYQKTSRKIVETKKIEGSKKSVWIRSGTIRLRQNIKDDTLPSGQGVCFQLPNPHYAVRESRWTVDARAVSLFIAPIPGSPPSTLSHHPTEPSAFLARCVSRYR